ANDPGSIRKAHLGRNREVGEGREVLGCEARRAGAMSGHRRRITARSSQEIARYITDETIARMVTAVAQCVRSACLLGSADPVAGSKAIVRRPSGAVAGEMSHLRKRPLPAAATNSPAWATTSPRTSVVIGQPLIVLPS